MTGFVLEAGEAVDVGSHGKTDYVFMAGEPVPNALDGASSYDLTWASEHKDFRVRMNMDSSDGVTTPDLRKIRLTI